jgi:hypothetical protein
MEPRRCMERNPPRMKLNIIKRNILPTIATTTADTGQTASTILP